MLINGEKFACEACIRGHRVSSCHHQDRPLVHVNKKGRPVSQCQHCRGLRKARSQHVHCECHQKGHTKDDCHHEKGEGKQEPNTCCCQHTGKCTCALKKDHLEAVPEDNPPLLQPKDPHKTHHPNLNSHETKTTIFSNGHHKPVHKFNDAHNQWGAPYKIPAKASLSQGHREIAQRSVDNLPLTNRSARPHHESPLHNSMVPPKQTRMVKSEHNSPHLGPTILSDDLNSDFSIPAFDPNAYSYSPFGSNNNNPLPPIQNPPEAPILPERFPESWFMTYEQAHDYEPPPVDWSQYHFDSSENLPASINNSGYGAASQPPSFASLEQFGHLNPGLTSSSGDVSEVEDFSTNRPSAPRTVSHNNSHDSPVGDDTSDRYRLSSASSYMGTPQGNMLASDNVGNLDIDEYLRQAEAETRRLQLQNQQFQMQPRQQPQQPFDRRSPSQGARMSDVSSTLSSPGRQHVGEHPYTVHEAQQIAHMNDSMNLQKQQQKFQTTTPNSIADDPAWSMAPDMSNPTLTLDDEQEDEDWVR